MTWLESLTDKPRSLLKRWREARERAAALAELRRMDRARLADLGITRDEIRDYVRGAVMRGVAPARETATSRESAVVLPFPSHRVCGRRKPQCCAAA